uniref:Uncharacterized protein n=1 Tax=Trichogramma kaykai TaxID=54128 RepID=A0ABD2X6U1_9HYME
MRRMGDVWKTTTNRSSRNAQLTPASPKQCLTADSVILHNLQQKSVLKDSVKPKIWFNPRLSPRTDTN